MSDELVSAIVDLLDREQLLAEPVSRSLLLRLTDAELGCQLQVSQLPFRRQWLFAFVGECAAQDGGLAALVSAIGRMDGRGRVHRAVDLLVRGSGATVAVPAEEAGPPAGPSPLTELEATALAEVYSDPAAARRLLHRSGLPYHRHPVVEQDSAAFWAEVNRLLAAGALPDGRVRILREAARDFPANRRFSTG
ncbi:effector-associated domain EAD1-containing protein [Parafrankia sp. BMG5.11]|nr:MULTISPECIES: effector-associated domain EAD1-containing protein [unclassified Parafrankia]TCJ34215.1 hypothetical protein E0504_33675 [Parafrankia sp. BMG5.11]SQE00736.1 conserved hypothetical protein [Parafrankia sp. Ea1.12]